MNWLAWRAADRANRICLVGGVLARAIVAFSRAGNDDLSLTIVSSSSAFDQRNSGLDAHAVDVSPRLKVVQRIEDDVEALKPFYIELRVFDVGMMCFNLDVRVEAASGLFRDLGNFSQLLLPRHTKVNESLQEPWSA